MFPQKTTTRVIELQTSSKNDSLNLVALRFPLLRHSNLRQILSNEEVSKWMGIIEKKDFCPEKAKSCLVNWAMAFKSPAQYPNNFEQVFRHKTPSLAAYSKYRTEGQTSIILAQMIRQTADFFNIGSKSFDDKQTLWTAELIRTEYYFLNFADIALCFRRGMVGKYDKLYNRFDGGVLLIWLQTYAEERIEESMRIRLKEHHNRKVQERNPAVLPQINKEEQEKRKKNKANFFKNWNARKKKEQVKKAQKTIVKKPIPTSYLQEHNLQEQSVSKSKHSAYLEDYKKYMSPKKPKTPKIPQQ